MSQRKPITQVPFHVCMNGSCSAEYCSRCGDKFLSVFGYTFGRHHCRGPHNSSYCTGCGNVPFNPVVGSDDIIACHVISGDLGNRKSCTCRPEQWGNACSAICSRCSDGRGEARECTRCSEDRIVKAQADLLAGGTQSSPPSDS
jgi:hypothetical protein